MLAPIGRATGASVAGLPPLAPAGSRLAPIIASPNVSAPFWGNPHDQRNEARGRSPRQQAGQPDFQFLRDAGSPTNSRRIIAVNLIVRLLAILFALAFLALGLWLEVNDAPTNAAQHLMEQSR